VATGHTQAHLLPFSCSALHSPAPPWPPRSPGQAWFLSRAQTTVPSCSLSAPEQTQRCLALVATEVREAPVGCSELAAGWAEAQRPQCSAQDSSTFSAFPCRWLSPHAAAAPALFSQVWHKPIRLLVGRQPARPGLDRAPAAAHTGLFIAASGLTLGRQTSRGAASLGAQSLLSLRPRCQGQGGAQSSTEKASRAGCSCQAHRRCSVEVGVPSGCTPEEGGGRAVGWDVRGREAKGTREIEQCPSFIHPRTHPSICPSIHSFRPGVRHESPLSHTWMEEGSLP
jgi:hypothetical protein